MPSPPKAAPRATFIPAAPEPEPPPANGAANANVSSYAPVARYKDETMKTAGLRMPAWVSEDWTTWCKARGFAVGPTAGQALLEYMERHSQEAPNG